MTQRRKRFSAGRRRPRGRGTAATAAFGKPVEVWRQDEAGVGQQDTLTRLWARRGSRPPAPPDRRYAQACLFGAVCPARRTGAGLVTTRPDEPPTPVRKPP
jgi:hypothetical protein